MIDAMNKRSDVSFDKPLCDLCFGLKIGTKSMFQALFCTGKTKRSNIVNLSMSVVGLSFEL